VAVPDEATLGRQLATRALIGVGGTALASLPERDGERLWVASVRTAGRLLRAGGAGGIVHDLGRAVQQHYPAQLGDIAQNLRSLELERAERIKARDPKAAPTPAGAPERRWRASRAGVPLRTRRTRGARWSLRRPSLRPDPSSTIVPRNG
jgi:hypothetical protein